MARRKQVLTDTRIRKLSKPGRYIDGDGLHLVATQGKTGLNRKWVCRLTVRAKRRDIGLGSYPAVSLAEARETTASYRKIAGSGGDPLVERRHQRGLPSFAEAAHKVYDINAAGWKNPKHRQQWINTLQRYVFPHIGQRLINEIGTPDILDVLLPIWTAKPETARRVKQRISTVFDWASAKGYVQGNPVSGVTKGLPKPTVKPQHMASMHYGELPAFVNWLRNNVGAASSLALEFTILTAARTSEVIGATWPEFDLDTALWVVPAERMKAGRPHRVPLSNHAIQVLETVKPLAKDRDSFVFESPAKPGQPLSNMAMLTYLKRSGHEVTVHGFRASFRDWCAEQTSFPHAAIEKCLAHEISNEAEAAYHRTDYLEKRREIMAAWDAFLGSKHGHGEKVVRLER